MDLKTAKPRKGGSLKRLFNESHSCNYKSLRGILAESEAKLEINF